MVQIPILNGIFTDIDPTFRTSYPRNLVPVPKATGISEGFLRPADGLVEFATGPGFDRGGIFWEGSLYRVKGENLVSIDEDGVITIIGSVGTGGYCTFAYSFDHLAIASGGNLWLFDGTQLRQNTDPDLGLVISVVFLDGYFVTTDGEFIVVTELGDPFSVRTLKYGSSEISPDAIESLHVLRNELYAVNTNTIEVFDNVGGGLNTFPFARITGAQIERGSPGVNTCAVMIDSLVFVGAGKDEAIGVYQAVNGASLKISSQEVDRFLELYSDAQLDSVVLEVRVDRNHEFIYIHFPELTAVYDRRASIEAGVAVWFTLDSGISSRVRYRARGFVWAYNKWITGDPIGENVAEMVETTSHHFDKVVGWSFGTMIIYNETRGAIFHGMELTALTGQVAVGVTPVITTEYSGDGLTWSQPRTTTFGSSGARSKRIQWRRLGFMDSKRMQRFSGTSDAHITIARLDAAIEPLGV